MTKKPEPKKQSTKQKPYVVLTLDNVEYSIYEEETNYSVFKESNSTISRTYLPNKKSVDQLVASLTKTGYTKS